MIARAPTCDAPCTTGANTALTDVLLSDREDAQSHALCDHWLAERVFDGSGLTVAHRRDFRTTLESQTPLGRIGQTEDIALGAVCFASSDSTWITGETLRIAGGLREALTENDFNHTKGKLTMKPKLQRSKNVIMNKPDEKRQGMKVRTVVTGHNAKGRAVFVRDEKVDGTPIPGLGELAFLWNANEPATYPNAGNNPAAPGIFPPLGGIRFIIGTYLPGDFIAPEPTPEMHLEDGDELGGANAGFHRTDTTDFGVVLSGNLALQLDDGAEVSLSPGDVLIENGTRHRWRVVGNVPATLASFIIGAQRR